MSEPHDTVHHSAPLVFGPIGCCIYCTSTTELSREHVIPFALGGGVILLDASCSKCQGVTQKFEEAYLKFDLGHFRAQTNFPSGKKKQRPTHKPVMKTLGGDVTLADLNDWPVVLPIAEFKDIPGALRGAAPAPIEQRLRLLTRTNDGRLDKARAKFPEHIAEYKFHTGQFIQVLAKIAHGLAFMLCDARDIQPLLLPIIREGKLDEAGFLIGKSDVELIETQGMHAYRLETLQGSSGQFLVSIRLRLFLPVKDSPTYQILVGKSDTEPQVTLGAHLPKPGGQSK